MQPVPEAHLSRSQDSDLIELLDYYRMNLYEHVIIGYEGKGRDVDAINCT
jgi:hypothetical protein